MPGHTWWALGLFGEIDGTRVAFTGEARSLARPAFEVQTSLERAYDPGQGRLAARPTRAR